MITIEGYLLQGKLESALRQLVGEENWRGRELRVPDSRRRWDMAYQIQGHTTVVEFDGDQHYWDSLKIKVDAEKDAVARSLGYSVVRIPYWCSSLPKPHNIISAFRRNLTRFSAWVHYNKNLSRFIFGDGRIKVFL